MPKISASRALFHLPLTAFFWLLIGIAQSPPKDCAAEALTEQIGLLAEHGIKPDTASLTAYLQRLHPDRKVQAKITMLLQQLSDVDFATREAAFKKLPTFGEAARPQLEAARKSTDPEVRWRAGTMLAKLDSGDELRLRKSLNLAVLEVLKSARDPDAGNAILAAIPVLTNNTSRNAACEALWACTAAHHAGALAKAIEGDNVTQRAAALVALEVASGAEHAEAIAKQLASDESLMRLAAARALIDRQPRTVIEVLIPLTGSEDQEIAWQADVLLQLKTGQLLELSEKQSLCEAWQAWAGKHLASAKLDASLGPQRLDLTAGRNQFEETFSLNQESIEGGYGRFLYTADNGGRAKVADGKLRIDGNNAEGDQRLFITSQKMIGRDRWPDKLELTTRLAGENGNNFGWHLGVSAGRIKALFHPGVGEGEFRVETTDDHDYIFNNEDMGFDVRTGVTYEMTMRVVRTTKGAEFEVTVKDENSGNAFRRRFSVTHEQLGKFDRIGLERSGRSGADAVFDSVAIRLGR